MQKPIKNRYYLKDELWAEDELDRLEDDLEEYDDSLNESDFNEHDWID